MLENKTKFLIIAFSEDLYKFHYALTMASSLKALEKEVTIFISGYSCNYIRKNWQDFDIKKINKKIKDRGLASLEEIFKYCEDLKVKIFYCETALNFLQINQSDIRQSLKANTVGMYSILNSHKADQIIFI